MKGLNIKRIAALGIGAALIGSALAPVVSAEAFNNLDTLEKADVVSSAGIPVVDVVVGGSAAISDVVWAGNIAARVAQLATKPATGTGSGTITDATVDVTVGGTQEISGAGNTDESDMNFTSGAAERKVTATVTDMPTLVNNTSWAYKDAAQGNSTTYISEQLDANMQVTYQDDQGSNRFAPGELIGNVTATNELIYSMSISPGYQLDGTANMTNLDSNVYVNYTVPLLGENYVIDRIENVTGTGAKLTLFKDTTPITLDATESVIVTSTDGATEYTLELVDITKTADNSAYTASFVLKDGDVVVDEKSAIASNTELKSVFGDVFGDSVYVTYVGASGTVAGKAYVSLRTGDSRLEIRDLEAYPYSTVSSENSKAAWKADVVVSGGKLTGINVYNNWRYNQASGATSDLVKNPIQVGESISFPNDFAKVELVGMKDKPTTTHMIGNDKLVYKDYKGATITLPFYVENQLTEDAYSKVTLNDREYTFHLYDLDGNRSRLQYALGSFDNNTSGTYTDADFNHNVPTYPVVNLALGAYKDGAAVNTEYSFRYVDSTYSDNYLALDAQVFDMYSKTALGYTTELTFVGTDTNEDLVEDKTYYEPHTSALSYSDDKLFNVARFTFNEGASDSQDVNLYINTATGNVLDVEGNNTNLTAYTKDGSSNQWTDSIRNGVDYLASGLTEYGTEITSADGVFSIALPEERRQAQIYVGGSATSTEPVGGETLEGLADGEKGTTLSGTEITVSNINGTASGIAGGVEVVKAGDLVKVAGAFSGGKSIIVGGFIANIAAKNLQVTEGNTLEDMLVASGDYVAAKTIGGDIVAAGFTADDTGDAARALIIALESDDLV